MKGYVAEAQDLDPSDPCALCQSTDGRKLSHIIPKFVFQHAAVRSPTGYLRDNLTPNRRIQDGVKEYMLCGKCEARFARWERSFSNLFKAHHERPGRNFSYTNDDALAALSIVWRVAAHARLHPELNHLTFGSDYSRTDSAFQKWSSMLLGTPGNPGSFRIFWIWFNHITDGPEQINRYIFHACDFDLWASNKHTYSIAHLPGLILIGAMEPCERRQFRGFDVCFRGGSYIATENKIAPSWVWEYVEQKMKIRAGAINSISETQSKKIEKAVLDDPEKAINSQLFRSMLFDRLNDE